jgi:hypothetical protein
MKEPKRLSTISDDPIERRLLVAGRAGAPRAARERALAAASAAVATTGLVTGSAAAGGTLAKLGSASGLKWLAIVGFLGTGAVAGEVLREHASHVDSAVVAPPGARAAPDPAQPARLSVPVAQPNLVPSSLAQPNLERPIQEPSTLVQPDPPVATIGAPQPSAAAASRRPPAPAEEAPGGSTTREELAWLDGARAAIAAGDPARGLSLLDGYVARFPRGTMRPEATVLRIEALMHAGDALAARRAADAFLAANPQSPYAPRIQSLLVGSNH